MENRSERMGSVATTADVLEAQQKEQKVRIYKTPTVELLTHSAHARHFDELCKYYFGGKMGARRNIYRNRML